MDLNLNLMDALLEMDFFDFVSDFEEREVTIETLASLPLDTVREIIPEARVKEFIEKRRAYFTRTQKTMPKEVTLEDQQEAVLVNQNEKANEIFSTENVDLKELLSNTYEGKQILFWFNKHNRFNPKKRKRLVHLMIAGILHKCRRNLNKEDFMCLRAKIVELFPSESAIVYYSPFVSAKKSPTGKSKKATGKLLHKYNNLKKINEEVSKAQIDNASDEIEEEDVEVPDDIQDSIDWLKNNEEPWDDTILHWNKTATFRHGQIGTGYDKKVSTCYEEWEILKVPKGYMLIELDFKLRQFSHEENAISKFHNFFMKTLEVKNLRKDVYCDMLCDALDNGNLNEDNKAYVQLILLCHIAPSTARIKQGNRKFWKPSSAETLDGIVARAKIYGDIDKVKQDRRAFAVSRKITVQPYVIVVGEEDFSVDSVYVCIDENTYEIPSFLQALDVCFKSFHVFNARYTIQSEQIWLLLQLGLYKFKTKWDAYITCVHELLNDMEYQLPS